jgi:hypothetical protein
VEDGKLTAHEPNKSRILELGQELKKVKARLSEAGGRIFFLAACNFYVTF